MFYNFNNRSLDEVFVTSDTHFGHTNVIKYSKRPFAAYDDSGRVTYLTEEMDEQLIENWNRTVPKDAIILHLGDFGFYSQAKNLEIWNRLNGAKKIALRGNHDKSHPLGQHAIHDTVEMTVEKRSFSLHHYAQRVWNKSHYGAMHCYGHSHSTLPEIETSLSCDVGVDAVAMRLRDENFWEKELEYTLLPQEYRPVSLKEFVGWMSTKTFKPVDHHDRDRK